MKLSWSMLVSVNEALVKYICVIILQLAKQVFAFKYCYSFTLIVFVSTKKKQDLLSCFMGKDSIL